MKKFRFAWIIELVLFFVGFYIVYTNFLTDKPQDATPEVVEQQPETNFEEISINAQVCIDIDEEKNAPLLAKKEFNKYIDYLYCFTEVSGSRTSKVVHSWIYNGTIESTKDVNINPDARVGWSKMEMSPEKSGKWQVEIRLPNGDLLGSTEFRLR